MLKFRVGKFMVPTAFVLVPAISAVSSLLGGVSTGFIKSALLAFVVTAIFMAVDNTVIHPKSFSFSLGSGLLANQLCKLSCETLLLLALSGLLHLFHVHVVGAGVGYTAAIVAWIVLCWEALTGVLVDVGVKLVFGRR